MDSRIFNWYMNYCCRDDYGATTDQTSAWAGIQYFASREPEKRVRSHGRRKWLDRSQAPARARREVRANRSNGPPNRGKGTRLRVFAGDIEYQAEFVIFAAPTFLAPYLIEGMSALRDFEYSPWLTANLTLERIPETYGGDPTWDSVFMDSPTLGYVDATHQTLRTRLIDSMDFYWALADGSPRLRTVNCC